MHIVIGVARKISIHVLHVEDDLTPYKRGRPHAVFQSTSSMWRTTWFVGTLLETHKISIHVLHVEDDSKNREKSLFAFI